MKPSFLILLITGAVIIIILILLVVFMRRPAYSQTRATEPSQGPSPSPISLPEPVGNQGKEKRVASEQESQYRIPFDEPMLFDPGEPTTPVNWIPSWDPNLTTDLIRLFGAFGWYEVFVPDPSSEDPLQGRTVVHRPLNDLWRIDRMIGATHFLFPLIIGNHVYHPRYRIFYCNYVVAIINLGSTYENDTYDIVLFPEVFRNILTEHVGVVATAKNLPPDMETCVYGYLFG